MLELFSSQCKYWRAQLSYCMVTFSSTFK